MVEHDPVIGQWLTSMEESWGGWMYSCVCALVVSYDIDLDAMHWQVSKALNFNPAIVIV
jgi:hypothetical protein